MDGLGERIREVRKRQGLSLRDLASRCKFSASFLSQVERGISSPSIVSFLALCEALGVPASDLLGEDLTVLDSLTPHDSAVRLGCTPMECPVLRSNECPSIHIPNSDVTYRWLSGPSQEHEIEVVIGEIPASHDHPIHTHVGEEFGYVLDGNVEVIIDDATYLLHAGDSYTISGARPHGFRTGASAARILWYYTRRFMEWYASTR